MRRSISIGLVSEALSVLSSAKKYNCQSLSQINQLAIGYGINKPAAIAFASQCSWVNVINNNLYFTESGEKVLNRFNEERISQQLWRSILYDYVSVCRPAWASRIPLGRKEASIFMTNDEKRCFFEAGLLNPPDEAIVLWWDILASKFREEQNDVLEDVGRTGEKLTIRFEEERTGIKPKWVSIETNLAGYDIMSRVAEDDPKSILIEVKSSQKTINEAKMIITRNEWDVASTGIHRDKYFFYLWLLSSKQMAIIPAIRMKNYIPEDRESGKWLSTEIPFFLFDKDFKVVEIAD